MISTRTLVWLGVYGAILIAWFAMALMASNMPGFGLMRYTAPDIWAALCLSAADARPFALFAMWALMSVAMMLPTFLPAVRTFQDLGHAGASDATAQSALVIGYLFVWFGFSAVAALVQAQLSGWELLGPDGASTSLWLTAALLLVAGVYQFSALKDACLSRCRAPLTFFLERWAPGQKAAFRMGTALGAHCLGCCWALMALGFVGGTMNLLWMGLATVFMAIEKLPSIGGFMTRPLGWGLVVAGLGTGLMAMGMI